MSNQDISKDDIMAIYPKVAEIIADALGCDEEEVQPESSLINDLDAESIDFLDIVFRLEREFKVNIFPIILILPQISGISGYITYICSCRWIILWNTIPREITWA